MAADTVVWSTAKGSPYMNARRVFAQSRDDLRTRRLTRIVALALIAVIAGSTLAAASDSSPASKATRGPEITRLDYGKSFDPRGKGVSVIAFNVDRVNFITSYQGKRVRARGRNVQGARWNSYKDRKVFRLIRHSLIERGEAIVRVRAYGGGRVEDVRVVIHLARHCSLGPGTSYPITCVVWHV